MGNFHISIEGVGAHHGGTNDDGTPKHPKDANVMAKQFADELKRAGHSVSKASITFGGKDDLLPIA